MSDAINPPPPFLRGRVAMVTGGASGIGLACALALADAGARVVIGSRQASQRSGLPERFARREALLVLDVDVGVPDQVESFYRASVETFGAIDILVNAAGIFPEHPLTGHPDALWNDVLEVNLNGVYRTCKRCLPEMIRRQWGRIINIASTAASVGAATYPAYCASKAGVVALTRCMALEGAAHGVTCNTISPGWVETDAARRAIEQTARTEGRDPLAYLNEIKQTNPQQRMIQPSEIAHLVLFLCQEGSKGITMQDLTVAAGSLW
ncbi:MAG: SDR family oxidoreductase [Magnetococcales bacterium]|nr:SDR family oxidoreductase [Magnetococcales bacterium]